MSVDLPRTAYSRYHNEIAEREIYVYILQVVALGSMYGDVLAVSLTTMLRNLDCHLRRSDTGQ